MVITHDSDAVDAKRRWGLVVIIAVLQALPPKKIKKSWTELVSVLLCVNCEHIWNSFLRLMRETLFIFGTRLSRMLLQKGRRHSFCIKKKSILLKQNAYLQSKRQDFCWKSFSTCTKNKNMHNVNQPGNDISKVGLFWLMILFICPEVLYCYITTGGMETLVK